MKRPIRPTAFLVCCLAASPALANPAEQNTQQGPAGIVKGEALLAARAKLLKHGWRPTRRHATDGYEYSGAELQLSSHKIVEVDSCSMDSSRCILYYAKKRECLRIGTIGEQLSDTTITHWTNACPDAPTRPRPAAPEH